jgi:iron complex outermembrane receptor protein
MPDLLPGIKLYNFVETVNQTAMKQYTGWIQKVSIYLVAGFLSIIMYYPCFSQENQVENHPKNDSVIINNSLAEVVISAYEQNKKITDLPASVFYLSPLAINRFNPADIVSAVNTVPGVSMQQRSPQSYRLDIRGSALRSPFGVRNVKIYYNGIPITDPGGNTYLNELSPDDIHSLAIIKGPAGSLYGAGTGGAVLINSPLLSGDSSRERSASLSLEAGSYGLQKISAGIRWGNNELRYADLKSNGYREQTAMHSKIMSYESLLKRSDRERLSLTAHYTDLYYQIPGALTKTEFDKDPKAARPASGSYPSAKENKTAAYQKNFLLGINENYHFNNHLQSTLVLYGAYTDFENPTIFNYEFRKEPHFGGRLVLQDQYQIRRTRASFWLGGELQQGFFNVTDHQNDHGHPDTLMTDDNVNYYTSLLFAQADLTMPHGWELTVAASFHHASVRFTSLYPGATDIFKTAYGQGISPRLALSKKAGENCTLYANASSGFSPPTVSELLPSTSVINKNLHAEEGINYEIGGRGFILNQKLYYDIDAFIFNLKKSIALRRDSSGADYFVNAGGTKQHGVEAYLSYPVLQHGDNILQIWASGSWFNFRYKNYQVDEKDYSGDKLPGTSPFTFTSGIDVNTAAGLSAHLVYTYNDRIPLDDANSLYASPYNLLSCRVDYNRKISKQFNFTLLGGVNNIFNETYSLGNDINAVGGRSYNAAPGINFYISIVIKYLM